MATGGAARQLFEKVSLGYIEAELLGKDFENHILECKEKESPEHGGVAQGDESHFAKGLSGFANTSGGVLIFGLKATTALS